MRSFRALSVCLLAVLVCVPLASAQTLEDKVKEFELENGMQFVVIERHEAPVVFCAVAFRVGAIYERPGITGISHLLEHMLFKGTETVGTKDYQKELAYLAEEDRLAEEAREILLEIEPWRMAFFDEYATELVASLSEEDRRAVGTDHALELEMLVGMLTERGPTDEMLAIGGLTGDGDASYFDRYVALKSIEMLLYDTMEEHHELVISNEFDEMYLNNGARMVNAGTGTDDTFYFAYLPANRLELFMLMESDRLANAVFREYYTERDVVMEERRMGENDPEEVLWDAFMATAYTASPYGVPIVGWMSDLKTLTRADLQDYYDRYYRPNNAMGVFVGDVDVADVEELARKYFGPIERGPDLPALTTREPKQQGERRVVVKQDAKPSLMIGYHIPTMPHPDAYPLRAAEAILSEGRTSRFYKRIYEEKGLTRRAPTVDVEPGTRLDPLFVINADPKAPHTLEEVEAAVLEELEHLKTEPVTMRELERLWNADEAELVRYLGSNVGLAFTVGLHAATRGDWRSFLTDMERLKMVTPDDIMRVASEYFTEENRTVGWLVETAGEGEKEEKIDFAEIMAWAQTLPEAERSELMTRFQSLDEAGREALVLELWERMRAEKADN
jgi:predicted Zn-dependent peptidase